MLSDILMFILYVRTLLAGHGILAVTRDAVAEGTPPASAPDRPE